MDFVSDALFTAGACMLTVVDCHTREALAIVPRVSIPAFGVLEVLDRLERERERGAPQKRAAQAGAAERQLVPVDGGRAGADRGLEKGVQRGATALSARGPDPEGVHRGGRSSPKTRIHLVQDRGRVHPSSL